MPNKDQIRIVRAFKGLVQWAKTQLRSTTKTFFSDNDQSLGLNYDLFAQDIGVEIIHSAPYADSQHGKPERAGGVIMTRSRAMLIAARLPEELWPLAVQAAVYLLNRTPSWTATTDGLHTWTTPHERMLGRKPNLANLRVFGCRAYVRDAKVPKGRKMAPRAWIGYMVGFVASNIWQIWHPRHQQVFNERDVTFDETLFYDPDLPLPQDIPIRLPPPMVEMIQLPPAIKEADAEISTEHSTEPSTEPLPEPDPERLLEDLYDAEPLPIERGQAPQEEAKAIDSVQNQPLTPKHTPLPESPRHEDPHERTVNIPGAFDSGPATPESTHLEPFFIPANNEMSSEENGANTEMDPAARQLSIELEDSSAPPREAAGGEAEEEDNQQPPAPINRHQNTARRAGGGCYTI